EIAPHLKLRRSVTSGIFRTARRAWKAFTSPDPRNLSNFLSRDSNALPELRRVMALIAQEYPDPSGLSRVERRLLQQFSEPAKASVAVANVMRGETFGDTYYFAALERMLRSANQLLRYQQPPSGNLRTSHLVITDFGRDVL